MRSPILVADPAWLGSQFCVKCTRMSFEMKVCSVLLPATLTVRSHSARSVMDLFLACRVFALTDCCCRPAAAVRPLLYRLEHSRVSSFGAVPPPMVEVGVTQRLQYFFWLAGSRLSGACTS